MYCNILDELEEMKQKPWSYSLTNS